MLEDLRTVAAIPEETLKQLSETLMSQSGFLSQDACADLIGSILRDETQGAAVFVTVWNLPEESLPKLISEISEWRNASEENGKDLPDAEFGSLRSQLKILVRDYPAVNRMQKAQRLMNVLGNEVKGIGFICDARPVYNKAHEEIEGLVPLTTFKIIYERQNLDTEEIEFVLTESGLDHLIEQANEAKKKLSVLSSRVNTWLPGGCVKGDA
jgi:hypothetical protein